MPKFIVPIRTAGRISTTSVDAPEQVLLASVAAWNKMNPARSGQYRCLGWAAPKMTITNHYKQPVLIPAGNPTHDLFDIKYDQKQKTIFAFINYFTPVDSSNLVPIPVSSWNIVTMNTGYNTPPAQVLDLLSFTRIDFYKGATPFLYPCKNITVPILDDPQDDYDRAMGILG